MKRHNKRGFTIVELVIVIAVIAILAAVLIPTFGNVINKAHESAAVQTGASFYKEVLALDLADGELDGQEKDKTISDLYAEKATAEKPYAYPTGVTGLTYTAENGATTEFKVTLSNGYTVSRETDGSFKAEKTKA